MITSILISAVAWFVLALALFFNPVVNKLYQSQENFPGVRVLPKTPGTMGKIFLAVVVQCTLWAFVYSVVKDVLPLSVYGRTLWFGSIIAVMKMIPRDIDRLLLTTYPGKRMMIEFIIGVICAYVVAAVFAYFL